MKKLNLENVGLTELDQMETITIDGGETLNWGQGNNPDLLVGRVTAAYDFARGFVTAFFS